MKSCVNCAWGTVFFEKSPRYEKQTTLQELAILQGSHKVGERKNSIGDVVTAYHSVPETTLIVFEPFWTTLSKIFLKPNVNCQKSEFVSDVFSKVQHESRITCALLIDNVSVKSGFHYHGCLVFGRPVNCPDGLPSTLLWTVLYRENVTSKKNISRYFAWTNQYSVGNIKECWRRWSCCCLWWK